MATSHALNLVGPGIKSGRTDQIPRPGQTLAAVLSSHRLSERQAADRLGLSQTELRRWISGERRVDSERLEASLPAVAQSWHALRAELLAAAERAPMPITARHLNVSVLVGRASEEIRGAVSDGEIDPDEARRIAKSLLSLADEAARAAADVLRGGGA